MFRRLRRAKADIAMMNQLLPAAERIAHIEGVDTPGAEHLLLAALDLPDGSARRAFAAVGADRDQLSGALAEQHGDALAAIGLAADDDAIDATMPAPADRPRGIYRSQPSAQTMFQEVIGQAKAAKQPLTGAHVVLAATRFEHGSVARALSKLRIDSQALADHARREIDDSTDG